MALTRRTLLKAGAAMGAAAALDVAHGPRVYADGGSPPVTPPPIDTHGRLILLQDDMRSVANWVVDPDDTQTSTGQIQQYKVGQVTTGLEGMALTARKATAADKVPAGITWVSGRVTTRVSFLYGRVAVLLKVPTFQGMWPGMCCFPADGAYAPELDLGEWMGGQPNSMHQTDHWVDAAGRWQAGNSTVVADMRTRWHLYELWWQPRFVTWMIDGVPVFSQTDAPTIPTMPLTFSLNLAVSGPNAWGGPTDASTPATASLYAGAVLITS